MAEAGKEPLAPHVSARFEIEHEAGSGGMGRVYRARDVETGLPVALKVLLPLVDVQRFEREALLLRELEHPAIVRYVAHGRTLDGKPWLAMEWLDGEDLATRLEREELTIGETVVLASRVADALGTAHARGVVHRDVKPANLFLIDGDVARVTLLDFGIARAADAAAPLTATGLILGTPGYMAPEQAWGERSLDARADVFSLGCVLFRCLAGRPAFRGDGALATLLKVVLDEPPRLRDLRVDIPASLDALVARMLSKEVDARPADGHTVAASLASWDLVVSERVPETRRREALTASERQVMCVVLGRTEAPAQAAGPSGADAPTRLAATESRLTAVARHHGGTLAALAGRSEVVVTFTGGEAATDLAGRAASCVLELRELLVGTACIVTGRGVVGGREVPLADAIDRGVELLGTQRALEPIRAVDRVWIDDVTAALLDLRFEVGRADDGCVLVGGRRDLDAPRGLLGKATPYVGRARELAQLEGVFAECIRDREARAFVVIGGPGMGKSRLRQELLARIAHGAGTIELWSAAGDPMSAGSPFGMLAQIVRATAGVQGGDAPDDQRRKLVARVARHVPLDDRARVSEFLGEMAGTPFSDDESVQLRAARDDRILMGDQIRRGWEDFIAAETAARPLVLVLEDLHWGDLPSVRLVDGALRLLGERPLLVLAFGRPDVLERFPNLWAERDVQTLHLGELKRKPAEQLVRSMLGEGVDDATVARLVTTAGGNPLCLEELIRSAATGGGDRLPESALAIVQAELADLDAPARRVLRAASVFGQTFWEAAVAALVVGDVGSVADVRAELSSLADRGFVRRVGDGRLRGHTEHVFRHELVREAAYAMLTYDDRDLGHALAAEWLEAAGETDAAALAMHFERGRAPARAVAWYRRAAIASLEGNDFRAALQRVERAVACGAEGETLGELRLLQAEASRWLGEVVAREGTFAAEALRLLPRGGRSWLAAASELLVARGTQSQAAELRELALELDAVLRDVPHGAGVDGAAAVAAARAATQLLHAGQADLAGRMLELADALVARATRRDPAVEARLHQAHATAALVGGDAARHLRLREAAAAAFDEAGNVRAACAARASVGYAYLQLGAVSEAEASLRDALAVAGRMGLTQHVAGIEHNLGLAVSIRGATDEALAMERKAADWFRAIGSRHMEGAARCYLAAIHDRRGEAGEAEREARAAVELLGAPTLRALALGTLARVLLARGERREALDVAREAVALVEAGGVEEGESIARLAHAEALLESGDAEGARAAIRAAEERLEARAAAIPDSAWRASFLQQLPENARTLELARRWNAATR